MIIIGAKGFAKEVLDVCHELGKTEDLVFYDDLSIKLPEQLFGQFDILRNENQVKNHFEKYGPSFVLGIGSPTLRKKMTDVFEAWGGEITSVISPKAHIGSFGVNIGLGATILANASITTDVNTGKGLLMYPNSIITHDCELGDYVELSPGATLLGNCTVGNCTHIGANATILPKINIGANCVVGAGAVVTKSIGHNQVVKGIPAK